MKKICFVLALTSACAQSTMGARPNIPATRNAIESAIDHDGSGRKIVSMGNVRVDRAVVYTEKNASDTPREEVWIKSGDTWKPEAATAGGGGANPAVN